MKVRFQADADLKKPIVLAVKRSLPEIDFKTATEANPKVREHIYRIWMDVPKKYPVDGLHFDYIRFVSPDFERVYRAAFVSQPTP